MTRAFVLALFCLGVTLSFACTTSSSSGSSQTDDDAASSDDDQSPDDDDTTGEAVWTDPTSGLMWQNNPSPPLHYWADAKNYCAGLKWGGYTGWRLPDIDELRSLIRGCAATESGGSCGVKYSCLDYNSCFDQSCSDGSSCPIWSGPGPGGAYWPSEISDTVSNVAYWSSSARADNANFAWDVTFSGGNVYYANIDHDPDIVRCVRDGSTDWSAMPSGTTASLYGVWGSSHSDVFAVGTAAGGSGNYASVILHYDGSTWSAMTTTATARLQGVWGSSAKNVFAVGYENNTWDGVILHYDGTTWSAMKIGTTGSLYGVWGSSATDVFAVGEEDCANGFVLHYDGASWSASETTAPLWGVWGSSHSDVFALGTKYDAYVNPSANVVFHFDGSKWSEEIVSGPASAFGGISGNAGSNVFAVSSEYDSNGYPIAGVILHYNGSSWSAMTTQEGLTGVWGSPSSSDLFAVGDYGGILHYDGSSWSAMPSGTKYVLRAVWGSSPTDVFAVGPGGKILHYGG